MHEPWIERVIRTAQEEGKLEAAEGVGKPIPGLARPYDPAWWARNWIRGEQARGQAAKLARQIEGDLPKILSGAVIDEMRSGLESLNAKIAAHNSANERNVLPSVDVDSLLKERAGKAD